MNYFVYRRADAVPTKNNKICSCHFKDSLRENGPSIFEWNKNVHFSFKSPEKHTKYTYSKLLFICVVYMCLCMIYFGHLPYIR